jgi:N-acetylneuraminic acid mutarotase
MQRAIVSCLFVIFLTACGDDGADGGSDAASVTFDAPPAAQGWTQRADVGGGAIQETAVVEHGGRIYVIGGFDANVQIVDAVRVYDPGTDTWSEAAPLPMAVHHANTASVGGRLYVLGALTGLGFTAIANAWEYDADADEWTDVAPMPAGTERGSAAVGVIDGLIYLAGGYRSGSVTDVSVYDPVGDSWDTTLAPLPEARDHLVGGAVGDSLYAIGGRNGGIGNLRGQVDIYDPVGDGWSSGAEMLNARGGSAAGVVNGTIIVVGGEGNAAEQSGVFAQNEQYDPLADEWTALEPMPTPRHGMGAAGFDGVLYVPGGATTQAFGAVATHEIYKL